MRCCYICNEIINQPYSILCDKHLLNRIDESKYEFDKYKEKEISVLKRNQRFLNRTKVDSQSNTYGWSTIKQFDEDENENTE
jgi:hypothetical protein